MSLVMIEYVLRGWLWVAPIEPTIGNISLGKLVWLNFVLSSHGD